MPDLALPSWHHNRQCDHRLGRHLAGDHPQIMGDHAPADPPFHPRIAVIPTPLQPLPPLQPADAPFDPRPPAPPSPDPGLPLLGVPRLRLRARLGQHDLFDAQLPRRPFSGGRGGAAIPRAPVRRVRAHRPLMIQAARHLRVRGNSSDLG